MEHSAVSVKLWGAAKDSATGAEQLYFDHVEENCDRDGVQLCHVTKLQMKSP